MTLTAPECNTYTVAEVAMAESAEDAFERLSAAAPEGWRVELIEGAIHVVSPANGEHEEIVAEVSEQVTVKRRNSRLRAYTGLGLRLTGAPMDAKVIPDLVIAPKGSFANDLEYHNPQAVVLVGEVTSKSTAVRDRGAKLRCYARAGIPLYLLIDREEGMAWLYSEPSGDHYVHRVEAKLSEPIALPEPLGFDLDTSEF